MKFVLLAIACATAFAQQQLVTDSYLTNPCMTVKCSANFHCESRNGQAACVSDPIVEEAPTTCAATSCMVGMDCIEVNGRARCVEPGNQSSQCTKKFEEFRTCATCEPTCANRNPMCNRMCQPARCMCRQGFFRNEQGRCITENDCDVEAMQSPQPAASLDQPSSQDDCRPNELFTTCSSMCEAKCGEYEPKACIMMCGPPACQCKQDFYRNSVGDCVNKFDCDTEASLGSITCDNIDCVTDHRCEMQGGKPVCIPNTPYDPPRPLLTCASLDCREGYHCTMIEGRGRCVENKPSITCANVRCMGPCTDTENGPSCGPRPVTCDTMDCPNGCEVNAEGKPTCVEKTTCATIDCDPCTDTPRGAVCGTAINEAVCPPNEEIKNCTNKCTEPFCGDENYARRCTLDCFPPECACSEGFVRNGAQGGCVKREECTKNEQIQNDVVQECPENEKLFPCSQACMEPYCGDEYEKVTCNTFACGGPSCHCASGFVRDTQGSHKCIRRHECKRSKYIQTHLRPSKDGFPQPPDNCDTVKCPAEYFCEMEAVKCVSGPCKPAVPRCKPAGGLRPNIVALDLSSVVDPSREEPNIPTCEAFPCPPNMECYMEQVQCFAPPCHPLPRCRESTPVQIHEPAPPTCKDISCPVGQECQLDFVVCKKAPCYPRPICLPIPGFIPGDEIVPSCDDITCESGQKCELKQVQCFRAPCHPIPECVAEVPTETEAPNSCSHVDCPSGQSCVIEPLQCLVAPCPSRAVCRPSGKVCKLANTVYDRCFNGCEGSCQNPIAACTDECGRGGCRCNAGYVRGANGECVRQRDCAQAAKSCDAIRCRRGKQCVMQGQTPVCVWAPKNVTTSESRDQQNCPANEVYDRCYHKCEDTCAEPFKPCTKICGPGGCRCATGLLRNSDGVCVKPELCPGPTTVAPEFTCATVLCLPGTRCVDTPTGANCEVVGQTCSDNEVYDMCYSGCESSCDNKFTICPAICGPGGCKCKPGFKRNSDKKCVPESECPVPSCPTNEQYDQCHHGCEASCETPMQACTEQCGPGGCRCSSGYIRDANNVCIPSDQCPQNNPYRRA